MIIDMSGERGAIAVPALRHSLRRSTVAHFARKVRATVTSRKCRKSAWACHKPSTLRRVRENLRPPHFASKVSYSASPQSRAQEKSGYSFNSFPAASLRAAIRLIRPPPLRRPPIYLYCPPSLLLAVQKNEIRTAFSAFLILFIHPVHSYTFRFIPKNPLICKLKVGFLRSIWAFVQKIKQKLNKCFAK